MKVYLRNLPFFTQRYLSRMTASLTLWIWPTAYRFCFGQEPVKKLVLWAR